MKKDAEVLGTTLTSMGHSGSVSRLIGSCRKSGEQTTALKKLANAIDEA